MDPFICGALIDSGAAKKPVLDRHGFTLKLAMPSEVVP